MASKYYGVNRDKPLESVVVSASTNSTDVELRVDTSKIKSRQEVYDAVESIKNALLRFVFP